MTKEITGDIVKKPKSKKNYINGGDFYLALIAHNDKLTMWKNGNLLKEPIISNYIGQCIIHIANRLGTKFNFASYTFNDEMISDAILKMSESVNKFDINYNVVTPNPFAYFTQIAWNTMLIRIKKESIQQYVKHKNFQLNYSVDMMDGDMLKSNLNNEDHEKIIDKFENPQVNNSAGYAVHKNRSYEKNRRKKNEREPVAGIDPGLGKEVSGGEESE